MQRRLGAGPRSDGAAIHGRWRGDPDFWAILGKGKLGNGWKILDVETHGLFRFFLGFEGNDVWISLRCFSDRATVEMGLSRNHIFHDPNPFSEFHVEKCDKQ